MIPESLQKMSDLELCKYQAGLKERAHGDFLAQNEWRRRDKLLQHELNQQIIKQQHALNLQVIVLQQKSTFRISMLVAFVGVFAAIAGAAAGAYIQSSLPASQQPPQISQQTHKQVPN